MAKIEMRGVHIDFPIYDMSSRSFKKNFIRMATGGMVMKDHKNHVVVGALSNINCKFEHGDRVGLIGHNGAGKSTLLRLLAGIYEPTHGHLQISGRVSPMLNLMQGLEAELTGRENIYLRGTLLGYSRKKITAHIDEISELTGLGDYLSMPTRTYSSGMMVRLAFAISTCIQPEILLVDEIFNAGDSSFMEIARNKMISLLDVSSIVIMANHAQSLLEAFCNKGLVLDKGKIVFYGPIDEAYQLYNSTVGKKSE